MHMPEVDSGTEDQKAALGRAMGQGQSVAAWAQKTGWRCGRPSGGRTRPRSEKLLTSGGGVRLSQAIGRMAGRATKAVDGIVRLAQEAESESVQLSAWRALLSEQMSLAKFSTLEARLLEVEEMQKAARHPIPEQ